MPRRKPPRPIDDLLPKLVDPSHQVRADAVRALGDRRNPNAVGPRIPLLRDTRVTVREVTAIALGKLGDPSALEALGHALTDTNHHVQSAAGRWLVKAGTAAVGPLARVALDTMMRSHTRSYAVALLGQIGAPEAVPVLETVLSQTAARGSDPSVFPLHYQALAALGYIRDERARTLLIETTGDANDSIRRLAIKALGAEAALVDADERAIPALVERLRRWDLGAVEPLQRLQYGGLADVLAEMLDGPWHADQLLVPLYLAYLGDERARRPLQQEHLPHTYLSVRRIATQALDYLDWKQGNRRLEPDCRLFLDFIRTHRS